MKECIELVNDLNLIFSIKRMGRRERERNVINTLNTFEVLVIIHNTLANLILIHNILSKQIIVHNILFNQILIHDFK